MLNPFDKRQNRWASFRGSGHDDVLKFASKLGRLGFDVMTPETEGAFVRIYAVRNAKKVDPKLVLPFRGHGQ